MFGEEKQIRTNVTIYHILEDGVIVTSILVSMHGNANSGKAYYLSIDLYRYKELNACKFCFIVTFVNVYSDPHI